MVEFFSNFSLMQAIVIFLIVLPTIVFVHEMGHYLVGRWCGIGAQAFSVGFGPEIFGFTDKRGTRWKFSAILLGGYVRFVGDMNAASATTIEQANAELTPEEQARAFHNKSVWRRAATVFAGPFANYLLAIVIFMALFMTMGRTTIEPLVGEVTANSAAEQAGVMAGDLFVELDGRPIDSFRDMQRYISPRAGVPIEAVVERGGERIIVELTPQRLPQEDRFGNRFEQGIIGVRNSNDAERVTTVYGPAGAFVQANKDSWFVIERTAGMIVHIITGRESLEQLRGPVGAGQLMGQVATLGFAALISLAALFSLSIGFLNLLPIPVLDGGHLVFYAIEAVRGRPVSERSQEYAYRVGFMLLIGLMVFVTWNDISRIFG